VARTLVRRTAKVSFFLCVLVAVFFSLGNPEIYINHGIASQIAQLISGDINAESLYDAYFYIDVIAVVVVTVVVYFITMKLFRKIRNQ